MFYLSFLKKNKKPKEDFLSEKRERTKGFTLVEMLVVILILVISLSAIIGVFVSAIRAQRYALAAQQLLDQTSYAMEYMGKSLRMAKKDLDDDWTGKGINYKEITGLEGVQFEDYERKYKMFFLLNKVLYDGNMERDPQTLPLTSPNLEVNSFNVALSGENENDFFQPKATFLLDIKSEGTESNPQPRIIIQTTVSQRDLDFKEK